MKIDITELQNNFEEIIQKLETHEEKTIFVIKDGKPLIKMELCGYDFPNRLGAASEELKGFDMSLEEFNSLDIDEFN